MSVGASRRRNFQRPSSRVSDVLVVADLGDVWHVAVTAQHIHPRACRGCAVAVEVDPVVDGDVHVIAGLVCQQAAAHPVHEREDLRAALRADRPIGSGDELAVDGEEVCIGAEVLAVEAGGGSRNSRRIASMSSSRRSRASSASLSSAIAVSSFRCDLGPLAQLLGDRVMRDVDVRLATLEAPAPVLAREHVVVVAEQRQRRLVAVTATDQRPRRAARWRCRRRGRSSGSTRCARRSCPGPAGSGSGSPRASPGSASGPTALPVRPVHSPSSQNRREYACMSRASRWRRYSRKSRLISSRSSSRCSRASTVLLAAHAAAARTVSVSGRASKPAVRIVREPVREIERSRRRPPRRSPASVSSSRRRCRSERGTRTRTPRRGPAQRQRRALRADEPRQLEDLAHVDVVPVVVLLCADPLRRLAQHDVLVISHRALPFASWRHSGRRTHRTSAAARGGTARRRSSRREIRHPACVLTSVSS